VMRRASLYAKKVGMKAYKQQGDPTNLRKRLEELLEKEAEEK
jgi:hypothetical protein